jgi:predicted metal-dependent peptidase
MKKTKVAEQVATYIAETGVRLMMRSPHMMVPHYSINYIDSERVPTMGTNGVTTWVNKAFYDCLTREQRMTAIAHELWHKMLFHVTRRGSRDPDLWNQAGDHVINLKLTTDGFAPLTGIKMPDGSPFNWLCDQKFAGMTTEQVYDKLVKDKTPKGGCGPMADIIDFGFGPDGESVSKDGQPGSGPPQHEIVVAFEAQVREEMARAATMARMAGKGTSVFDEALSEVNHVKIPWQDELAEMFNSHSQSEFSYRRYDRRAYCTSGFIAPDLYEPAMGGIVYGVDCSGSVSNKDLSLCEMHQRDIIRDAKPAWVEVVYFCDEIICVERYEKGEYVILMRKGSGGTCFAPVMEHVRNMEEKPEVVMMMTDLEGDKTETDPEVPVIWLCVSSISEAKFGRVLNVE